MNPRTRPTTAPALLTRSISSANEQWDEYRNLIFGEISDGINAGLIPVELRNPKYIAAIFNYILGGNTGLTTVEFGAHGVSVIQDPNMYKVQEVSHMISNAFTVAREAGQMGELIKQQRDSTKKARGLKRFKKVKATF